MPHFETNAVSRSCSRSEVGTDQCRELRRLANADAEHPANRFEQTSNGKRDGQSDQQDHERDRQRDARCSSEGDQPLKKRPSSARWPGDVNDVAEPAAALARIGASVCVPMLRYAKSPSRCRRVIPGFHEGGSLAGNESARTSSIARSAARRSLRSLSSSTRLINHRRRPAQSPRGFRPDVRWCFLCKARFLLTLPSGTCHAHPALDDAALLASRSTRPAVLPLWLSAASPGRTLSLPPSTTPL